MQQYTITEENDWEGESFGYIMDLTSEEFEFIQTNIKDSQCLTIEKSDYSKKEVKLVNQHSENTYMPRLGFYKFKEKFFDLIEKLRQEVEDEFEWTDDVEKNRFVLETLVFYKALGLT